MSELIILVGIPCSGKTTFAKYLQSAKNIRRISLTDIYKMIDNKYRSENVKTYLKIQELLITRLLPDNNLIIDDINLLPIERRRVISIARSIDKNTIASAYQMSRPLEKCIEDNNNRPLLDEWGYFKKIDENDIRQLSETYKPPDLSEGFNNIYAVRWIESEIFNLGNIIINYKPEITLISSAKPNIISYKRYQ